MSTAAFAQQGNPRLKNFKYGTGKASWWEAPKATPQPRTQVFYYPPAVRYYPSMPYYGRHFNNCPCNMCMYRRQQTMMMQWQLNRNRYFFFQFRF